MKKNVGSLDKAIRLFAGSVLIAVGLVVPMNIILKVVLVAFGVINVVTSFFEACPVYSLLGISTRRGQQQSG